MPSHRTLLPALLAATLLTAPALAQSVPPGVAAAVSDTGRPAADTKRDADRKPAETVAFSGVKPGDKVLELLAFGGYYTRILSKTVGPKGHIYSTMPDALLQAKPAFGDGLKAITADAAYGNVTMLPQPNGTPTAPEPVDVVWTSDNYHDLHNPGPFGAADVAGFNKAVFAALKPGGTFIVIDHAGAPGTGFTQTGTLHRADAEAVKKEVEAAGFTFVAASDVLHRAKDDFTAKSTDADEQFTFKFKKP
jgi:predicted methyltransferase